MSAAGALLVLAVAPQPARAQVAVVLQLEPEDGARAAAAEASLAEHLRRHGTVVVDAGTVRAALHFQFGGSVPTTPEGRALLRDAVGAERLLVARIDTAEVPWRVALTTQDGAAQGATFGEMSPEAWAELQRIAARLPPLVRAATNPTVAEDAPPAPSPAPSEPPVAAAEPPLHQHEPLAVSPEGSPAPEAVGAGGAQDPPSDAAGTAEPTGDPPGYSQGSLTSATRAVFGATAGTEGFGYGLVLRLDFGLTALPTGFASGLSLALDVGLAVDYVGLPNGSVLVASLPMLLGASWRIGLDAVQLAPRIGLGADWVFSTFLRNGTWSADLVLAFVAGASVAVELGRGGVRLFGGIDVWIGQSVPVVFTLGLEL